RRIAAVAARSPELLPLVALVGCCTPMMLPCACPERYRRSVHARRRPVTGGRSLAAVESSAGRTTRRPKNGDHRMTAATVVEGIDDALARLGVSDGVLTPEQYAELDTNGYLAIPDVVDEQWLQALRSRTVELLQR